MAKQINTGRGGPPKAPAGKGSKRVKGAPGKGAPRVKGCGSC